MTSPGGRRRRRRAGRRALATVVTCAVAAAVVAAIVLSAGVSRPGRAAQAGPTGGRGSAAAVASPGAAGPRATAPGTSVGTPGRHARDARWLRVLTGIDRRRGAAWRAGDPGALRTVFVAGSGELAADRRMLRGYAERGLHVDGVRMAFVVEDVQRRQPGRVGLIVIDRLGAAVARDPSGVGQPLPRDLPTRHHIALQRVGRQWRIAAVTPA